MRLLGSGGRLRRAPGRLGRSGGIRLPSLRPGRRDDRPGFFGWSLLATQENGFAGVSGRGFPPGGRGRLAARLFGARWLGLGTTPHGWLFGLPSGPHPGRLLLGLRPSRRGGMGLLGPRGVSWRWRLGRRGGTGLGGRGLARRLRLSWWRLGRALSRPGGRRGRLGWLLGGWLGLWLLLSGRESLGWWLLGLGRLLSGWLRLSGRGSRGWWLLGLGRALPGGLGGNLARRGRLGLRGLSWRSLGLRPGLRLKHALGWWLRRRPLCLRLGLRLRLRRALSRGALCRGLLKLRRSLGPILRRSLILGLVGGLPLRRRLPLTLPLVLALGLARGRGRSWRRGWGRWGRWGSRAARLARLGELGSLGRRLGRRLRRRPLAWLRLRLALGRLGCLGGGGRLGLRLGGLGGLRRVRAAFARLSGLCRLRGLRGLRRLGVGLSVGRGGGRRLRGRGLGRLGLRGGLFARHLLPGVVNLAV